MKTHSLSSRILAMLLALVMVLGMVPTMAIAASTLSAPVISPNGGTYEGGTEVTITAEAGEIYYTLDGSAPTAQSTKYTKPFKVYTQTLKAIAVQGEQASPVAEANFVKKDAPVTFAPASGMTLYKGTEVILTGNMVYVLQDNTDRETAYVVEHGTQAETNKFFNMNTISVTNNTTIQAVNKDIRYNPNGEASAVAKATYTVVDKVPDGIAISQEILKPEFEMPQYGEVDGVMKITVTNNSGAAYTGPVVISGEGLALNDEMITSAKVDNTDISYSNNGWAYRQNWFKSADGSLHAAPALEGDSFYGVGFCATFPAGETVTFTIKSDPVTAGTYNLKSELVGGTATAPAQIKVNIARPGVNLGVADMTTSSPKISIINTSNQKGGNPTPYYLVKPADQAEPSAQDIIAGNRTAKFDSYAYKATADIADLQLEKGKQYTVYGLIKFDNGITTDVAKLTFTAGEPYGIKISVSDIQKNQATLTITSTMTLNEYDCNDAYYIVKEASDTTVPDIETLQGGTNVYPDDFYNNLVQTAVDTMTGLKADTEYIVYAYISHDYTNPSDIASITFKTSADVVVPPTPAQDDVVALTYKASGSSNVTTAFFKDFATLQTALDAVPVDATEVKMTLLADQEVSVKTECDLLTIKRDCTFDMAGHTLTTSYKKNDGMDIYMFGLDTNWEAETPFTLTIEDSSPNKTGLLWNNGTGGYVVYGNNDKGSLTIKSGNIKSTHYKNNTDLCVFSIETGATMSVEDGNIEGFIVMRGHMDMSNGYIESNSVAGTIELEGSIAIHGGTIHNNHNAKDDNANAVNVRPQPCQIAPDGEPHIDNVFMDGGTLSSVNGPALFVNDDTADDYWDPTQKKRSITISSGNIISENYVAIAYNHSNIASAVKTASMTVNISGDAKLEGKTAVIKMLGQFTGAEIGDKDVQTLPAREIKFADTVKVKYGAGGTFVLPNSSVMTLPEGKVLDVKADADGFYGFATKESLKQTVDNIQYGYQNMDRLNTTIASAKEIYDAGQGKYDATLWQSFEKAYKAALPIPSNANANQNEINHFTDALGTAQATMIDQAQNGVDVSKLADGTYTVDVELRVFNDDRNRPSMSNGALKHTANLTMKDGKGTIELEFNPIQISSIYGSLMQYWFYDAASPEAAKAAALAGTNLVPVNVLTYGKVDLLTGGITPIEGEPAEQPAPTNDIRPIKVNFQLPYMGTSNQQNEIYTRVSVDAMSGEGGPGDQNVTLFIKYHTLTPIEVKTTLSVSENALTMKPNEIKKVTAEVLGAEGYTITWATDNGKVATVDNGYITAVAAGDTNITVTATKEGADTLTRTITVKVNPSEFDVAKDALKADIDAAKQIQQGNKTLAAFETLQKAIKAADAAYFDKNATVDSLKTAKETLAAAVTAFNESKDEEKVVLADGKYTAIATMKHEYQDKNSMCDVMFDAVAGIEVNGDDATLTLLVANPVPAFPDEGADGTVKNVVITYNGKQYPMTSKLGTGAKMTAKASNSTFGFEAGKQYDAQVLTVTLPKEAIKDGALLTTSCFVNVIMMTDVVFRMALSNVLPVESAPAPEVNLTVKTTGKPYLTWTAVEGADKYEVWCGVKDGSYELLYSTRTGLRVNHNSAKVGETYFYMVRAIVDGVEGEFSEAVSIQCNLAAPKTELTTKASSGKPYLTWNDVDGAEKYVVYRKVGKNGTYEPFYTTKGNRLTNTSAKPGVTYYYKVMAVAGNLESAFSTVKSKTCDCARPDVKLTTRNGHPYLSWKKVDGAVKYEIYRSVNGQGYELLYTTRGTHLTNSSAKRGQTCKYRVKAICSNRYGNSALSYTDTIKVK